MSRRITHKMVPLTKIPKVKNYAGSAKQAIETESRMTRNMQKTIANAGLPVERKHVGVFNAYA
ncbi:MAG: hypothetical protein WCF95_04470 [bacterium]